MLGAWCFSSAAEAVEEFIPRKQSKPPNKPYSPTEAIARMTVPPGFSVELVAAEPDIVNPVAMTFDERGRIWITESLEYPRKPAGKGRDRVKILEDADGDGTAEKVSIFADGLNIPSGIAVGAGGVWVANAPDILFYPDANRDGVADGPPQVVVTGFGRDDTHELPNSLIWGPDGWLYGLNGVFNASHVRYGRDNPNFAKAEQEKHPGWKFTCAMFRIHPRTREFQVFCEGTSNPWGIAFNDNGDAFVSACVIDHLWHLVETGYYHRQGGPYPPHTWKLESIVDYKHQMAAYCGITWFDSDAYPEQYRKKLYMGNIHGGCINVDGLERNGATYKGVKQDDFLTANDVWFMPVVQKVGPDGCLYILDWYDRYHCYQDANHDPAGVDRLKGRLYRVRYKETPRAAKFDLATETDDQLIQRLGSPNVFYRETAQRLLRERSEAATCVKLESIVLDVAASPTRRLSALWALAGGAGWNEAFNLKLLEQSDEVLRAWGMRLAGSAKFDSPEMHEAVNRNLDTAPPAVRLQAIIAARKLYSDDPGHAVTLMFDCISRSEERTMQAIVWQNLLPILSTRRDLVVGMMNVYAGQGGAEPLVPYLVDWLLDLDAAGAEDLASLVERPLTGWSQALDSGKDAVDLIARRLRSGEISGKHAAAVRAALEPKLTAAWARLKMGDTIHDQDAAYSLAGVLAYWKHDDAIRVARAAALSNNINTPWRSKALEAWASSRDPGFLAAIPQLLAPDSADLNLFGPRVLDVLSMYDGPEVADVVLQSYPQMSANLRAAAVELLTSRVAWSNKLLDAIASGKVTKDAVNVNQVRKLLKIGDKSLAKRVEEVWGELRTDRNPQRERVVATVRDLVKNGHGDPLAGQAVFGRLCGQCHKIHGTGQDVGPDITVNGRSNFEQLLSNIFDPSLVIGGAYQPRIVSTADGRVLTGLLVEDNPQRIVLKLQGGKLETIPRSNVDEIEVSKLSLMPEGVETQYKPQEIVDLFAFLKLDKPPQDPAAKTLPGFSELDKK